MTDAACRLDRWLWMARFFKSRTRATAFVVSGRPRLNGAPVGKAHALVRPGDVLTFALGDRVRVIRVAAIPVRRGPAAEAQLLYADIGSAPSSADAAPADGAAAATTAAPVAVRPTGSGRPTKRQRRQIDRLPDA